MTNALQKYLDLKVLMTSTIALVAIVFSISCDGGNRSESGVAAAVPETVPATRPQTAKSGASGLPDDFEENFNRLFLSDEVCRYRSRHSLLACIDYDAKSSKLSSADVNLVRAKLKAYLKRAKPARYTPDSALTGLAPRDGCLRCYAVGILEKIGEPQDILFIEELRRSAPKDNRDPLYYPGFEGVCRKAIDRIRARQKQPPTPTAGSSGCKGT